MTQRWNAVHAVLHRFGVDMVRHPGAMSTLGRRLGHFRDWEIDVVVDVGANVGQYGRSIRSMGYRGRIMSIEPLPTARTALQKAAGGDDAWQTFEYALGRADGRATLFVSGNAYSSSLFRLTPAHIRAAPDAQAIDAVGVDVHRLDALAESLIGDARHPLLKLDTQGSELDILEGAGPALGRFVALHVELSLVPMYEGGPAMTDVVDWLERRGFVLAELEPELSDPGSGRLLQVNGLFFDPARVSARRVEALA